MKFMNIASVAALAAAGALAATAASAQTRDTIQIAGSSTVLPFASVVAEDFGNQFPEYKTPVVQSGGTGAGLRQFCTGVGPETIDIANASRPIQDKEIDACQANGVKTIVPVKVGYDGIVFATNRGTGSFNLTPAEVFQALAAKVPQNGAMVDNPYTKWSQINPELPDQEITLVIPGTNHGTREVFEEKVVNAGCGTFEAIAALSGDAKKAACLSFRNDGRVVEVAGDYTETLARLDAQKNAMGVFGLSFYDQNRDKLELASVDGVVPSMETIGSGEYPVSRPLFFYIKGEHIGVIPGLEDYALYFLSDQVSGEGSQLVQMGLIPLSDAEREAQVEAVKSKASVEKSSS